MNILEVRKLSKSFKNTKVLNAIDLKCKAGEIIGLYGRNGSGKSTFLKILFGTSKADCGEIRINGKVIKQHRIMASKAISYLPQDTFLPQNLTPRAIIPIMYPNGDDQDKIFYAPQMTAIETTKIGKLSMGQLRYFELLLIGNLPAHFLLLDEPFSMIEPLFKEVIKEFLLKLKHTKGIIITDHYYEDVLQISEKNYLLKEGEKINVKDKNDLKTHKYLNST